MNKQGKEAAGALKIPRQAPPVIRAAASCVWGDERGMTPSVDWDSVTATLGPFLTGLASLMGQMSS